jgi:hypothetical protein
MLLCNKNEVSVLQVLGNNFAGRTTTWVLAVLQYALSPFYLIFFLTGLMVASASWFSHHSSPRLSAILAQDWK